MRRSSIGFTALEFASSAASSAKKGLTFCSVHIALYADKMAATARTINTSLGDVKTSLNGLSAKVPATLGQKTMANSLSVVLASDSPAAASGGSADPLTDPNNIVRNIFLKLGSGYYESIVNPETVGCAQAQMPNPIADGGVGPAKIFSSDIGDIGGQFEVIFVNAANAEITETLTLANSSGVATATTTANAISIQSVKCLTPACTGNLTVQLYLSGYETIYTTPIWAAGNDEGGYVMPAFQVVPAGYKGYLKINSITPWGLSGWSWVSATEYPGWMSGGQKYIPKWGMYMSPTSPGDFTPAKTPDGLIGPFAAGSAISVRFQRNTMCYAAFSLAVILVPLQ